MKLLLKLGAGAVLIVLIASSFSSENVHRVVDSVNPPESQLSESDKRKIAAERQEKMRKLEKTYRDIKLLEQGLSAIERGQRESASR